MKYISPITIKFIKTLGFYHTYSFLYYSRINNHSYQDYVSDIKFLKRMSLEKESIDRIMLRYFKGNGNTLISKSLNKHII